MERAVAVEREHDPKSIVGSIFKASRLLDMYSWDRREISLGDFTRESGFNKTTVYRLLQTMVGAGWLTRTSSGAYRLGLGLLVLGSIARADLDLRDQALPFMQQLADEFGDTAFLMVPGPHGAVTVETIVGANPVRVDGPGVGAILPYYVAAGPVVIAAYLSQAEAAVLDGERTSFTRNTVVDADALMARFDEVRRSGYSVSREDFSMGVSAVAAPVLATDGTAIASLSVGGPANRFTSKMTDRIVARVVEYARELSKRMNS